MWLTESVLQLCFEPMATMAQRGTAITIACICPSVCLSVHLSVCLSVDDFVWGSTHLLLTAASSNFIFILMVTHRCPMLDLLADVTFDLPAVILTLENLFGPVLSNY